ncbi:hypothetical protein [Methanobrevibacter thaueri]|uniref:Uncharacterized protein n=1 Tax=Methanobrevibacter thaueri TaxID=190975 RepID=A0A315XNH2_9EURY|nr:hypothetical protein [Methanobrevibacter thaueri]PWB87875.1 hypothetical protein MBBTH_04620 [Methanobrevibacter thaueri]
MIVKIIDENSVVLGAADLYENNFDGEISVIDTFHLSADESGFDTIFGTNDREVEIQLDYTLKRNYVANEIVADIVSQRAGQVYDEELLCEFVNDYFESELEKIRELVDERMQDYLEEDNLTVKK